MLTGISTKHFWTSWLSTFRSQTITESLGIQIFANVRRWWTAWQIKVKECSIKTRICRKLCSQYPQATHYIEDLNNPQHCSGYEKGYHEDLEKIAINGYWTDRSYDGSITVKDYKIFAENTCRFSQRYFKLHLWTPRQIWSKDLYRKVITPLWAHAVNDILDLWWRFFGTALESGITKAYGLPEPIGFVMRRRLSLKISKAWKRGCFQWNLGVFLQKSN